MTAIRPAAMAGRFYPGNSRQLEADVRRYLAEAEAGATGKPAPKAVIGPHAGYVYSGRVAASAYARIAPLRDSVRRVVLLGPCHRVPVRGLALSSADAFETPLGRVPLDKSAAQAILSLPQVQIFDDSHALEHSLEVHLPFLQIALGEFSLVPLVVGDATPDEIAEVLERLWGGPETLIVVSSDLTHYLPYDEAKRIDALTCRAIETLDAAAIGRDQACGRMPVKGLLTIAKRRGLSVETVDIRNSGDTAGSRDQVVGYGSWVFLEPKAEPDAKGAGKTDARKSTGARARGKAVAGRFAHPIHINLTRAVPPSPAATGASKPQPPAAAGIEDFERETRVLLDSHGPSLLALAGRSIDHGLAKGGPLTVDPAEHAAELRRTGAAFVTLKRDGRLRGCIGSPQAHRPLVLDVADNAFRAAFKDPRFKPLTPAERSGLALSLSVLSPATPMRFSGEADLLSQLRPHIDGLIIADNGRRALFLPSVWEQISDAHIFLSQLKAKAGLARDHFSPTFQAMRFIAVEIAA